MVRFYARIPRTRGTRTKEGVSQKKKFKQEREKAESCGSKWEPCSWWARTGRKDWAQPSWGLAGTLDVLTAILLWVQCPKDAENAESFHHAPSLIQPAQTAVRSFSVPAFIGRGFLLEEPESLCSREMHPWVRSLFQVHPGESPQVMSDAPGFPLGALTRLVLFGAQASIFF